MRRRLAVLLLVSVGMWLQAPARASAQVVAGPCLDGVLPGGAKSRVCTPVSGWNGQVVVYAHGYVPFLLPIDFYNLDLPDGTDLPALIQSLGFAFATTSYRQNGLAILEGVEDVRELVAAVPAYTGSVPTRTWLTGVSEGGLVTALAAERHPELFDGAYALCGPVGDFRLQINYIGDFRVLFDYFFPDTIPGTAIDVPPAVIAAWPDYEAAITNLVAANPARARQLLRVAKAPYDPVVPESVVRTTLGLLRYNIYGANDARTKLGGNPYDNRARWYAGSSNDLLLNLRVKRFSASPAAVLAMRAYTPTGDLSIPLVTLHTTADEIVPAVHELIYLAKVRTEDRGRFLPLPVFRYGHCSFTSTEVLLGFGALLAQP